MTLSFSKKLRVTKKRDFQKIFHSRQSVQGEYIRLSYVHTELGKPRLGLTIGRKFGTSPKRNRFKRLIREIFRKNIKIFPQNLDLNISPKHGANFFSYAHLEKDFLDLVNNLK